MTQGTGGNQGIVSDGTEPLSRVESIVWATIRTGNTTPAAMLRELATRSREDYVAAIQAAGLHIGMDMLQRAVINVRQQLEETENGEAAD
jgi:hypothetical protein